MRDGGSKDPRKSPDRIEALTSLHKLGNQACTLDAYPTVSTKNIVSFAPVLEREAHSWEGIYETKSVDGRSRDSARDLRRGASSLEGVRGVHPGVANFRRLLMAGRRPVREDHWQSFRRGGSARPQE